MSLWSWIRSGLARRSDPPESPAEVWQRVGLDIDTALANLDAALADPAVPAADRERYRNARLQILAAREQHQSVTPEQVELHIRLGRTAAAVHVYCGGCGEQLAEDPATAGADRQPCPRCGSRARRRDVLFG